MTTFACSCAGNPLAREVEEYDAGFFGPSHPNIADWYLEMSDGRFTLSKAALVKIGPLPCPLPAATSEVFQLQATADADGPGGFEFKDCDANGDGIVDSLELALCVVSSFGFGAERGWGQSRGIDVVVFPNTPRQVRLRMVWAGAGDESALSNIAHELAHGVLGIQVRGDEINGDTWQFLEWGRAFEPFIETFAAPPGAARPGDFLIALGNLGRGARFLPHLIGADGALVPLETISWTGAGGAFQIPSGPVNGTVAGPRSGWYRFMILEADGGRAGSNAFGLEIANPAEDWRRAYFAAEELLDAGISGDSADPDLDDMPTLAEYIFGTDPREGPAEPGCCVGGVRRAGLRVQARAGAGC